MTSRNRDRRCITNWSVIVTGRLADFGITTANSGYQVYPSFSTTNSEDITGSTNEGARINVIGNPYANIPSSPGLPNSKLAFNPAAFAVPAVGTIGNAGGGAGILYGPGWLNFDASLSRSIPIVGEKRQLKLHRGGVPSPQPCGVQRRCVGVCVQSHHLGEPQHDGKHRTVHQ